MYNVKVIHYGDSVQVRLYDEPVFERVNVDDYGVIHDRVVSTEEVPFEKERLHVREWEDIERSRAVSRNRTLHKIYDYARANTWEWFVTFTFSPEKVNRYDYDDVCRAFKGWLDRVRRGCSGLYYLFVPELHKDGAFHIHGLLGGCDGITFVDSGVCVSGQHVYNIAGYSLGFCTATRVQDTHRVSSYIGKYITKDLCAVSFGKKRYWASRGLALPQVDNFTVEGKDRGLLRCMVLSGAAHVKQTETARGKVVYADMPLDDFNELMAACSINTF